MEHVTVRAVSIMRRDVVVDRNVKPYSCNRERMIKGVITPRTVEETAILEESRIERVWVDCRSPRATDRDLTPMEILQRPRAQRATCCGKFGGPFLGASFRLVPVSGHGGTYRRDVLQGKEAADI